MTNRQLSRRDLLRLVCLTAGGAVLMSTARAMTGTRSPFRHPAVMGSGMTSPGGMMPGRFPGVIDPPPGSAFTDPARLDLARPAPGVVEAHLTVGLTPVRIAGEQASLLTYNGLFPGPTIAVGNGETLRLHLTNGLRPTTGANLLGFPRNVTNIHTHGWHVSPQDPMDNVMRHIGPGETWTYVYDLTKLTPGALAWYHPHVHGLVAEQLWSGLAGALVVDDATAVLGRYETHLLVLKDITLRSGQPDPYASVMDFVRGKEGETVTVNGLVNPVLTARPGQVQRWRVLNASTARFYKLSLEGHRLHVIGTDGGLLDKPYRQAAVLLAPGERLDILVKASSTAGSYKLLSLPYDRAGMMGMGGGMMSGSQGQQVTLLTTLVAGTPASESLPGVVNRGARRLRMDLGRLRKRRFVLGMHMGRGSINGHDFDVDPHAIESRLFDSASTHEVWTIVNPTAMDHPWHQHVNHAQILTMSGGDAAYAKLYTRAPAWKDVVIVPRGGSVTQLVRVRDWVGMTMFHCHIVEHEDIGMLGMWDIR